VEGEMSTLRDIKARVPQGSVLSPILHNLYNNVIPQTTAINLALFVDDASLYAIGHKEGYVLRKLQRVLSLMAAWCKQWYIKIKKENARAIYFSHRIRPLHSLFTLNGHNIPFINSAKYLGVIFDKKITWRLQLEAVSTKV
jgi:hypothetical protein